MATQRRIGDYGIHIGTMKRGRLNKITDVPGVKVGHWTLDLGTLRTGVTTILPGSRNPFYQKPVAASYVLNGYGKSLGLVQVDELGILESPIALCGTLNVGLVYDALIQLGLEDCHLQGKFPTSMNAVVGECNDGRLSDIAQRPVRVEHVRAAMDAASEDFEEGSVGAGRGMICHGLKGGIGSASRLVELDGVAYTVGLLALTNHGQLRDLVVGGRLVGPLIDQKIQAQEVAERGSVMLIVATDLPVDSRQLGRILHRAPVGLARVGSYYGHGSGDVVIGFTTGNTMPFEEGAAVIGSRVLREDLLDSAFRAVAECCEEAVLNSLICADTTVGYKGNVIVSLKDLWEDIGMQA